MDQKNVWFVIIGNDDLMQKGLNFDDIANVSIKGSDYKINFWYISKNDAINIMKTFDLKKRIIINAIIIYKNGW